MKDWAALLRQGGAPAVLGKPVEVSGYVTAARDPDVFYVTRLMVSCCVVDAQPVGVPVSRVRWRDAFAPGSWVSLTGAFGNNPDDASRHPTLIMPTSLDKTIEPAQPYVF